MTELPSFLSSELIALIGSGLALTGAILVFFSIPFYFLKKDGSVPSANIEQKLDFIVLPAKITQYLYNIVWGEVGKGVFGVLTWRSFGATIAFSSVINVICIGFIISRGTAIALNFDLTQIDILFRSEIWFIICNFIGDLFSINITRYCLDKIINKNKHWRYILFDLLGIVGGYIMMLLPSLLVFQFGMNIYESPNDIIQAGLFGNLLIPFFLLVFAKCFFPSLLSFFALFSILSITVPTGIYHFSIFTSNISYCVYKSFSEKKREVFGDYAKKIFTVGGVISAFGSGMMALPVLIKWWFG